MPLRLSRPLRRAAVLGGLAVTLAAPALKSTPAAAQLFFEPFSYRFQYPPPERDAEPPMRPREASDAARSQGFEPVGRPTLNREVYVIDAQDRLGRPVRLIMDAYEGELLRVMPRVDAPQRSGRDDGPRVIEGVGPDDAARPRRDAQPRARTPKREAAAPPRVESLKPIESRPLEPPRPVEAAKPASPDKPAVAATRPTPPPAAPAPITPAAPAIAQPPTEAPGPIPSPAFASGAYSKPPAPKPSTAPPPAMPPVAPLDDVKPQAKATPAVPPAPLE